MIIKGNWNIKMYVDCSFCKGTGNKSKTEDYSQCNRCKGKGIALLDKAYECSFCDGQGENKLSFFCLSVGKERCNICNGYGYGIKEWFSPKQNPNFYKNWDFSFINLFSQS